MSDENKQKTKFKITTYQILLLIAIGCAIGVLFAVIASISITEKNWTIVDSNLIIAAAIFAVGVGITIGFRRLIYVLDQNEKANNPRRGSHNGTTVNSTSNSNTISDSFQHTNGNTYVIDSATNISATLSYIQLYGAIPSWNNIPIGTYGMGTIDNSNTRLSSLTLTTN